MAVIDCRNILSGINLYIVTDDYCDDPFIKFIVKQRGREIHHIREQEAIGRAIADHNNNNLFMKKIFGVTDYMHIQAEGNLILCHERIYFEINRTLGMFGIKLRKR